MTKIKIFYIVPRFISSVVSEYYYTLYKNIPHTKKIPTRCLNFFQKILSFTRKYHKHSEEEKTDTNRTAFHTKAHTVTKFIYVCIARIILCTHQSVMCTSKTSQAHATLNCNCIWQLLINHWKMALLCTFSQPRTWSSQKHDNGAVILHLWQGRQEINQNIVFFFCFLVFIICGNTTPHHPTVYFHCTILLCFG